MRATPFARVVRPVGRILFLADPDPDTYRSLAHPDDAKDATTRRAAHLFRALQATGADIIPTERPEDILAFKDWLDFVFPARGGPDDPGVDMPVLSLCELVGLPCLNGNISSIAVMRDRALAKMTSLRCGLDTPDWHMFRPTDGLGNLAELTYPRLIQEATPEHSHGNAAGIVAHSAAEAEQFIRQSQKAGRTVMAERMVQGSNVVVGVIGQGSNGPKIGDIIQVDRDDSGSAGAERIEAPGNEMARRHVVMDAPAIRHVQEAVRRLHDALKPLDSYQVNLRWNAEEDRLWFLGVEPTANFTPDSIFTQSISGGQGGTETGDHDPSASAKIMRVVLESALNRHALRLPKLSVPPDPATPDDSDGKTTTNATNLSALRPLSRLLFLGQFAPTKDSKASDYDPEWGSLSRYHHQLHQTLVNMGLDVVPTRSPSDIFKFRREIDFVFSVFDSGNFPSSEAVVPAICEAADIPFLNSGASTQSLVEDKQLAKLLALRLSIPTPRWVRVGAQGKVPPLDSLRYPCIVKWQFGANSKYIDGDSIVPTPASAAAKVDEFRSRGIPVIVEEFIPGTNLTTAAFRTGNGFHIGKTIRTDTDAPGNIQTYDQKMFDKGARTKSVFEEIDVLERIKLYLLRLYHELQPMDMFRVDFRYNEDTGDIYFLEANIHCNLDPFGTFCFSLVGGPDRYEDLIRRILSHSLERQGYSLPRPY